jgi:two-component system phosphate regulon sensor histidine kinase PhoR
MLFLFMAVGAVSVVLVKPSEGILGLGIAAGAFIWLIWDNWCSLQFILWVHRIEDEPDAPPPWLDNIRQETAEYIQRTLRRQSHRTKEFENQLYDFQSVLQASPNSVIILNAQDCIEWCNRTASIHFGLDAKRDLAQRITHLLRSPALIKKLAERDFAEPFVVESPLATDTHPMRLEVLFLPHGQGRLFMLSRDITAIEQAEAMRRNFVAEVSHEIRTPLTVLAGFIETLQTLSPSEEERGSILMRMAHQAERMKNLVNDLLTLSRLENNAQLRLDEWIPVASMLERLGIDARSLSTHLNGQAAPKHEIIFEGADTPDEIAGIKTELQSAFSNLVNNAIRYTPPGGKIIVTWQMNAEGGARFSVRDNGIGIAPEHIPRLMERFYRVDLNRSNASSGTGLGLAIVRHVLQRHDAKLEIDSTLSHGACFSVTFPAERVR